MTLLYDFGIWIPEPVSAYMRATLVKSNRFFLYATNLSLRNMTLSMAMMLSAGHPEEHVVIPSTTSVSATNVTLSRPIRRPSYLKICQHPLLRGSLMAVLPPLATCSQLPSTLPSASGKFQLVGVCEPSSAM